MLIFARATSARTRGLRKSPRHRLIISVETYSLLIQSFTILLRERNPLLFYSERGILYYTIPPCPARATAARRRRDAMERRGDLLGAPYSVAPFIISFVHIYIYIYMYVYVYVYDIYIYIYIYILHIYIYIYIYNILV